MSLYSPWKRILSLVLILTNTACVTARLNCSEKCAMRDMTCDREILTDSDFNTYNWTTGPSHGTARSEGAVCRAPASTSEEKLVQDARLSAEEQNASARTWNWIIVGASVLTLLVVGVIDYKARYP